MSYWLSLGRTAFAWMLGVSPALVFMATPSDWPIPQNDPSADSAQVAAVACESGRAYAARDVARLDELSAPDYVQTDVRGGVLRRAAYLDFVRARKSELRIDCSDVEVHMFGIVAVALGRWTYTSRILDTGLVTQTRWTSVWTHGPTGWKRNVFQNTYIDPDADQCALDKARAGLKRQLPAD